VIDLTEYRESDTEKDRIANLLALLPKGTESVLDVGARDGYISRLLAERGARVTALDLELPSIADERIVCLKGDVTALDLPDESFDLVFCAEVLEHIPAPRLAAACHELSRVSRRYVIVGVPFRQDTRVGRTTCMSCGKTNPPWGHVNQFDEHRLVRLFPSCDVVQMSFVGLAEHGTNALACRLMDLAGNPFGTYSQSEPCIHCGAQLAIPPDRNFPKKVVTRIAHYTSKLQRPFQRRHPDWIHLLLERRPIAASTDRCLADTALTSG